MGQLAPFVLWLRWGAWKLGRHICRVPRLGYPPLAVWHPGCPTGRDRKLPPTLGSLPWHRPDLFSSLEQLPLSAGQRGLAPVCSRAGASARAPLTPSLPTQALVSPSFPTPPQEEEIPELEIDVDELLDMESDDTRAVRVKELLVDCNKPTEPAGQDLGHAEAEHTPEVRVVDLAERWLHRTIAAP